MIGRFLSFGIFLVVASGLALHFKADIPYISTWLGHLPGDLILKKGQTVIYLPFTSSAILSAGLCALGSLCAPKK